MTSGTDGDPDPDSDSESDPEPGLFRHIGRWGFIPRLVEEMMLGACEEGRSIPWARGVVETRLYVMMLSFYRRLRA